MSVAWLLGLGVLVLLVVGVLVEVPKLRTAHINQLPERRRREAAARRTLAGWIAVGVLVGGVVGWWVFR